MFRDAKVGDKVWAVRKGWGEIYSIVPESSWPIKVSFAEVGEEDQTESFTYEGMEEAEDINPTLFWDEIKFEVPEKPVRLVDRTFEGWVNLYGSLAPYFHPTQARAVKNASASELLASFPVKVVVSGVPEGFTFANVEGWGFNELA